MYITFRHICKVPFSRTGIKMNIIELLFYKFKAVTLFNVKRCCVNDKDDPVERYALPNEEKIEWAFHILPDLRTVTNLEL